MKSVEIGQLTVYILESPVISYANLYALNNGLSSPYICLAVSVFNGFNIILD